MAEVRTGAQYSLDIAGSGLVDMTVTRLLAGGLVELAEFDGTTHTVTVAGLVPGTLGSMMATSNVAGLQTDPPAGIARVARNSIANVLPSPVAPETDKSGIVPDWE